MEIVCIWMDILEFGFCTGGKNTQHNHLEKIWLALFFSTTNIMPLCCAI